MRFLAGSKMHVEAMGMRVLNLTLKIPQSHYQLEPKNDPAKLQYLQKAGVLTAPNTAHPHGFYMHVKTGQKSHS